MIPFEFTNAAQGAADVAKALVDLLTGEKKLAFEYPFDGEPDFTVRVISKYDDLES